ncbi:MAG TPA: magnesium chelatase, partial [Planctomycetaceae bacterium]|nr:magnesium chelatase [Planctomycetaceae bacterium]
MASTASTSQTNASDLPAPSNLEELLASGWKSKTVKQELHDNLMRLLANGETLFPGIVGYDDTVIPEISIALLAGHDVLFLGEKGQAKSKMMRGLVRFLDEYVPYIDIPDVPVHEDPLRPITRAGKAFVQANAPADIPIGWWHRDERYAERLSPGTKFADIIGEIDPSKL